MEFKLFNKDELLSCVKTFIEVFNEEPWNDKWTLAKAEKYLIDFSETPGFIGVVAVEDNHIAGFIFGVKRAWWSGDEFFIQEMCVSRQYQGKGVGKGMLSYLTKELYTKQIDSIVLLTDRGIPAEEFYKNNGFEEIERIIFLHKSM